MLYGCIVFNLFIETYNCSLWHKNTFSTKASDPYLILLIKGKFNTDL